MWHSLEDRSRKIDRCNTAPLYKLLSRSSSCTTHTLKQQAYIYITIDRLIRHPYTLYDIPIGVNRPAFGGTVPHFHQMSRVPRNETDVLHFKKNCIIIFFVADYFTFLPCNATKWRSSIKARSILCTPTDAVYISRLAAVINHCCPPAASTLLVTCHGWWIAIG